MNAGALAPVFSFMGTKATARRHAPLPSPCRAVQPAPEALSKHVQWRHIRVEDGPGRALGRSYRVKLWPATFQPHYKSLTLVRSKAVLKSRLAGIETSTF
jgi:hypothetical protein